MTGRDIDLLIAKQVMGWAVTPHEPDQQALGRDYFVCENDETDLPYWSTNPQHANDLLNILIVGCHSTDLKSIDAGASYQATIDGKTVTSATVAEAISNGALSAYHVPIPEPADKPL